MREHDPELPGIGQGAQNFRLRSGVWAAVLVGLLVLPTAGTGLRAGMTDAAWHQNQVTAGSFTAIAISPARLTAQCRYFPAVLGIGSRVEMYWALPSGYQLSESQLWASTSGLGSALAPLTGYNLAQNTRPAATPGQYVTTVPTNLLGGLLGLGTELELSIVMSRHGWTSTPVSTVTNPGLVAGLGGNCRNVI
ncbi:hypothetical protein [Arthrobacter sp. B1805]|uniref:hypothetical protein n=1 Tax=Arthrobacter sp. B1805 TaxID=2058892 RepID=UPI000CE50720|nr:hypothetical protein [Arthrobacter sp. B1805]